MTSVKKSKTCPYCKKTFTKEEVYADRKYDRHLIERDWRKRKFCSTECSINYYSNQYYRRLEKRIEEGCEICGYDKFPILELHHIDDNYYLFKNRKNNSDNNIIVLCPNCHRLVRKGFISLEELQCRIK